ncbi:MAG: bifunctional YncE family protein/alkaline phosphatase family protein [Thermoleophilaceae bacterium]
MRAGGRATWVQGAVAFACVLVAMTATAAADEVGTRDRITATLHKLEPYGDLVQLGNFPGGAAVTPDGRFYWTVSAGWSGNDVRIVDVASRQVVQVIQLPGASGGVALDGVHHLAYVSGEPDTDNSEVRMPDGTPGRAGDVVHVFHWSPDDGKATAAGLIPVPPSSDSPPLDNFPPAAPPARRSWPERLAVSPDGGTLLVALGLADRAAVIDTSTRAVRYVQTGSHPFGAAILRDGHTGLVTNRGPGTVSVIDLRTATKVKDIAAGPHLSHPEAITLDAKRPRAYVPLTNDDAVAVIDTDTLSLVSRLSVKLPEGAGGAPTSAALTSDGTRLLVAHAAADEISVYGLNADGDPGALLGRIPTADRPTDVSVTGGTLLWTAAKGFGLGPNPGPPFTSQYFDIPTRWSTKGLVTGYAGIAAVPTSTELRKLTRTATAQLRPFDAESAPAATPLRPGGPIKHVFYVVRENRTYDQVLGDAPRGDGDPRYAIFGNSVTPNAHALAGRFPLLDRFYADSEASIDGHYWTAAADNSDYVHRTWRQNYAGRQYPGDAWFFQIAFPQNGFIFDQAEKQGVSWMNLGEGVAHLAPLPDRDRDAADTAGVAMRYSKSDLGALTPGGCYDPFIGADEITGAAHIPIRLYDSSKPAGAPEPSLSRFDCFKTRFTRWQQTNTLPQLVYMTLPNDHTNGASPGHHTPRAMVADNDRALGQVVDLISHSPYWHHSAIFVVEDDSQDGMDHQDAHRIPAFVISPYAKRGAVIDTSYDFLSAIRSIELILGLRPLNLNDASALPMYDAFTSRPLNGEPFSAVAPSYNLLEENSAHPTSPAALEGTRDDVTVPDQISQQLLDKIVWQSVHGPASTPPPPGPNADTGG